MSAYSDYKCGALTDDEYKFCSRRELGEDHGEDHGEDELDMECEDPEGEV